MPMSSFAALRITIEPVEDASLVRVAGEIDFGNASNLRRHLDAARSDGGTTLLDLARVSFIDSAGLDVLLEASRAVDADRWAFFIVRPSPAVRRIVEITGTRERLALVAVDEAR
jgi:anti-anti-sigma factor